MESIPQWLLGLGIVLCVVQSGIFSGLNLSLLGVTKLQLSVEAAAGDSIAALILRRRQNSNRLLATIVWGNVSVNTLLALLSNSVFVGWLGFVVSVGLITVVGEIVPQAYFNKNLKRIYRYLDPIVRFYWCILAPVAAPTGWLLDRVVGPDSMEYYRERGLHFLLEHHGDGAGDISRVEALGARNFLHLDDILACREGKVLDPESVIQVNVVDGRPIFPEISSGATDPFVLAVNRSRKPWVVIVDAKQSPLFVLDADGFLREVICEGRIRPLHHCHRPIIITENTATLEHILPRLALAKIHGLDDVVDDDIVLFWSQAEKRIITGADILGVLLRGIANKS